MEKGGLSPSANGGMRLLSYVTVDANHAIAMLDEEQHWVSQSSELSGQP